MNFIVTDTINAQLRDLEVDFNKADVDVITDNFHNWLLESYNPMDLSRDNIREWVVGEYNKQITDMDTPMFRLRFQTIDNFIEVAFSDTVSSDTLFLLRLTDSIHRRMNYKSWDSYSRSPNNPGDLLIKYGKPVHWEIRPKQWEVDPTYGIQWVMQGSDDERNAEAVFNMFGELMSYLGSKYPKYSKQLDLHVSSRDGGAVYSGNINV